MINGIEDIGLADAIGTHKAVDFMIKLKFTGFEVFVIDKRQLLQKHSCGVRILIGATGDLVKYQK